MSDEKVVAIIGRYSRLSLPAPDIIASKLASKALVIFGVDEIDSKNEKSMARIVEAFGRLEIISIVTKSDSARTDPEHVKWIVGELVDVGWTAESTDEIFERAQVIKKRNEVPNLSTTPIMDVIGEITRGS